MTSSHGIDRSKDIGTIMEKCSQERTLEKAETHAEAMRAFFQAKRLNRAQLVENSLALVMTKAAEEKYLNQALRNLDHVLKSLLKDSEKFPADSRLVITDCAKQIESQPALDQASSRSKRKTTVGAIMRRCSKAKTSAEIEQYAREIRLNFPSGNLARIVRTNREYIIRSHPHAKGNLDRMEGYLFKGQNAATPSASIPPSTAPATTTSAVLAKLENSSQSDHKHVVEAAAANAAMAAPAGSFTLTPARTVFSPSPEPRSPSPSEANSSMPHVAPPEGAHDHEPARVSPASLASSGGLFVHTSDDPTSDADDHLGSPIRELETTTVSPDCSCSVM